MQMTDEEAYAEWRKSIPMCAKIERTTAQAKAILADNIMRDLEMAMNRGLGINV